MSDDPAEKRNWSKQATATLLDPKTFAANTAYEYREAFANVTNADQDGVRGAAYVSAIMHNMRVKEEGAERGGR